MNNRSNGDDKFARLFRESADAYLIIDDGVISDCNETSAKLLLMEKNELIGLKPYEVSPEYQNDGMKSKEKSEQMIEIAKEKGSHRFEWIHKRSNEESFWAEVVLTSLRNLDASITILVSWRDISKRKSIEEENNILVERLNLATENSHTGLWDWNIITGEVEFNEEWARICGYTLKELEPTNIETWMSLANQEDLEASNQNLQDHFEGKAPFYECEARMKHRNGHWVWVLDRGKVVSWTEDGKPQRMIGTHTEITQIKENSQKLKEAMEEAKAMAKKASEADQMKSQFLANISHEIRTPMNGVIGFLEMVRSTALTKEQIEYIDEAVRATGHMMELINDLLDYSKLEAGQTELEYIPMSVRQCVNEVIRLLDHRARKKNLDMYSLVYSNVPKGVVGDPTRLKQVLLNLLANAIKFTHEGEIKLEVRAVDMYGDNKVSLLFSVSDTGVGMTEETQNMLFKPFMQADTSTTRKYGGTGLGLSICKKLVELMGGSIRVESEECEGTSFIFEVDFEITEASESLELESQLKDRKILLIHESDAIKNEWEAYLAPYTPNVTMIGDIYKAKEALDDEAISSYDLILLDHKMEGLSSNEFAKSFAKRYDKASTKLILITGDDSAIHIGREAANIYSGFLTPEMCESGLIRALAYVISLDDDDLVMKEKASRHEMTNLFENFRPHLLLVDDNEVNQKLLTSYFKKKNVICDISSNGLEAVSAIKETSYDMILMDCQMPVMDGYEATKQIRQYEGVDKHTPIVALTANAMIEEREKCKAAGMDDYLSKPLKFEDLDAMIKLYVMPVESEVNVMNFIEEAKKELEWRSSIEKSGIEEIFKMYLNSIPLSLEQIENAIERKAFEDIKYKAHQLKGTSGNLHVHVIEEKMRALEEMALDEDIGACTEILENVKSLFEELNS